MQHFSFNLMNKPSSRLKIFNQQLEFKRYVEALEHDQSISPFFPVFFILVRDSVMRYSNTMSHIKYTRYYLNLLQGHILLQWKLILSDGACKRLFS